MTESDYEVKFTKKELLEANNKSIKKFFEAKDLLNRLDSWISQSNNCGYCSLAYDKEQEYKMKMRLEEKPIKLYGCKVFCYPPAKEICRKYVTGNNPTMYDDLTNLLMKIKKLLDDLTKLEADFEGEAE